MLGGGSHRSYEAAALPHAIARSEAWRCANSIRMPVHVFSKQHAARRPDRGGEGRENSSTTPSAAVLAKYLPPIRSNTYYCFREQILCAKSDVHGAIWCRGGRLGKSPAATATEFRLLTYCYGLVSRQIQSSLGSGSVTPTSRCIGKDIGE